jgi:putative PIN family toxin of toxin-antitoxin system
MLSKHSPYRPIWDAFLRQEFVLCVSNEILDEYQEIIEMHTTSQIADNIISLFLNCANVKYVDPHFRLGLITSDPDDNKFVDCAFASGADYIVSEDAHFKILSQTPFPIFKVVTMDEFLRKL